MFKKKKSKSKAIRPELHEYSTLYWASTLATEPTLTEFPATGFPPNFAKLRVENYQLLDFKPSLNTAGYVNCTLEEEELEIASLGLRANLADQTINPGNCVVSDHLLKPHNPRYPNNLHYPGSLYSFTGSATVGSTEACLLAGLALKARWRTWYAKSRGMTEERIYPNLVISSQYQACWEKFFKFMDVEPRFIVPSVTSFKITAAQVRDVIDEKTIGVVCILGNHYGGQYDPVSSISSMLDELNEASGLCVGIHVDAASGGFIAPFQPDSPAGSHFDFRLPNVLSISTSGHKYGQSCAGTGWVMWRDRKISEHVSTKVSYLGGQAESYSLNFSRPASGVYVQYYKFLRLGRTGYTRLCENMMNVAKTLRAGLRELCFTQPTASSEVKHSGHALTSADSSEGSEPRARFVILDDGDSDCLPVVTAMLNPELKLPYDAIDLQHHLAERHWYVSGYQMKFTHPLTGKAMPLFSDMPANQTMFRIVVKANLTQALAVDLLDAVKETLNFLDSHGESYAKIHHQRKAKQHHSNHTC